MSIHNTLLISSFHNSIEKVLYSTMVIISVKTQDTAKIFALITKVIPQSLLAPKTKICTLLHFNLIVSISQNNTKLFALIPKLFRNHYRNYQQNQVLHFASLPSNCEPTPSHRSAKMQSTVLKSYLTMVIMSVKTRDRVNRMVMR